MNEFKLSYYTVITDILDKKDPERKRIIYSTITGKALLIKNTTYQDIKKGIFHNLSTVEIDRLTLAQLIVCKNYSEIENIMYENNARLNDVKTLSYTLQPGAYCELNCHYCGQQHTKDVLPKKLYPKVINRVESSLLNNKYRKLRIKWYGAEPLMAFKQIHHLTKLLKDLTNKYNLYYSASIITNGFNLSKKKFEELVSELDVHHFQITLDGMPEYHDTRRITKSGGKTFEIIMNNIVNAVRHPLYKEKKCTILVRINIDKTNKQSVNTFLKLLASYDLIDKIMINFAPVVDWGKNGASKNSLTPEEFALKEIEWTLNAIKLGLKVRNNFLPTRTYSACMVENKKSEVFDAFGNIYPCYELPYTPMYENGEYLIGNLNNDQKTYKLDNPLRNWVSHVKNENFSDCYTCKFYPICGGGCPKKWIEGDYACPSFKFNIEDRLVLQYISNQSEIKDLL